MKKQLMGSLLFLAGTVLIAAACTKNVSGPDSPPVIQFNSVHKATLTTGTTKRDSVVITINYKDADGNLGESDSTRIKQNFSNQFWGNYRIEALQLVNGQFSEFPTSNVSKLFFPSLSYQNMPVEGTLAFSQRFTYPGSFKLIPVKFKVRIRDRNLNESNEIETDTIRLPVAQ